MHDRVRRQICRLLFVLFCALPTTTLVCWTCILHSPPYRAARRAAWQRDLSQQLGVTVTLQRVEQPNRGLRLLHGIELRDPETDQRIAAARPLELREIGGEWLISAAQPEVQGDQVWRLWEVLHEQVLRAQWQQPLKAQLTAGEVTIFREDGQTGTTLTDVRCQLKSTHDGPQATLEFFDVALQMAQPVRIRATRNRRSSPPQTRFELDTQSTALPCSVLADQLPILSSLGEQASFQGTIVATRTGSGWEADLAGRFLQVELDRVVTGRYPHKLSGEADVTFRRASIRQGKVVDAAGEVLCRGGVVSWSLLAQADRSLGLTADERVRSIHVVPLWPYQEMRFQFALSEKGIEIAGLCSGPTSGVVMADAHGPLLRDRPQEVAQVVALVQTLTSRDGQQLPASAEAYQLLHVLPIPSAAPRAADNGRPGYSPLRMQ